MTYTLQYAELRYKFPSYSYKLTSNWKIVNHLHTNFDLLANISTHESSKLKLGS